MRHLKNWLRRSTPPATEPLMYRVHLFEEFLALAGRDFLRDKRVLEIGPKDGLDSRRICAQQPRQLVLFDLPEKRDLVDHWRAALTCPHEYHEKNFMYLPAEDYETLGKFELIWCTGVLYHNAEQLRFLRRLYKLLQPSGYLVLESSTLRGAPELQNGMYVQIYYPETYRNTGTTTHIPSRGAIKAWLQMAGFATVQDSRCFEVHNPDLVADRYACIAQKGAEDEGGIYYGKSGLNPVYHLGDST